MWPLSLGPVQGTHVDEPAYQPPTSCWAADGCGIAHIVQDPELSRSGSCIVPFQSKTSISGPFLTVTPIKGTSDQRCLCPGDLLTRISFPDSQFAEGSIFVMGQAHQVGFLFLQDGLFLRRLLNPQANRLLGLQAPSCLDVSES